MQHPLSSNPAPILPYRRHPNLPGSDPRILAHIGRLVGTRLEATPAATRLAAAGMQMYLVRNFLGAEECTQLVQLIDADVQPSTTLSTASNQGSRTSQTCRLSPTTPLVSQVEKRMSLLLGIPLTHSETVQGQRYTVGQEFKMHNDYFAGGQPYSEVVASEGGQRTWTAMVYLNAPSAGGVTSFCRADVQVIPERGMLLTWNNNDLLGLTNPYSHHRALPVEAGNKYVLTKWFRERDWRGSAASDAMRG